MGQCLSKLSLKQCYFFLALIFFSTPSCFAGAASLASLEQLINQEQYAQAWDEAQLLKDQFEGDPRFDYFYGLAALETQHLDHALLALRRAVANSPEQVRPHLELARTYFLLNNQASALNEFKTALQLPMPAVVRQNVEQELKALETKASASSGGWQGSGSFALGHDSNVNLGVSKANINLPLFGEVTLDKSSVKQDSVSSELSAQFGCNQATPAKQAWFVNSHISSKQYPHAVAYNTRELEFSAGKLFIDGNKRYQLGANVQAVQLNDQDYSRSQALDASFNYQLAEDQTFLSSVAWVNTNYQQKNTKNQNNQRLQVNQQYQFNYGDLGHQLGISASHDMAEKSKYKYLNRDVFSLAYGINKVWNAQNASSISVNAQRRINQAKDLTYRVKRKDLRFTWQVAHQLQLSNKTTFFANAGYVDNNSNLKLYDSKKAFVRIGINHQF